MPIAARMPGSSGRRLELLHRVALDPGARRGDDANRCGYVLIHRIPSGSRRASARLPSWTFFSAYTPSRPYCALSFCRTAQ